METDKLVDIIIDALGEFGDSDVCRRDVEDWLKDWLKVRGD